MQLKVSLDGVESSETGMAGGGPRPESGVQAVPAIHNSTARATSRAAHTLPPFPEGWYFVASRRELRKAGLIRKTWMGEEIVVWRGGDGAVCVAEAYCPHLGADLGAEGGGRVCGGRLVCPFHGYEFDTVGQCVATPYADAPRSARLRVFETREICGLIFAWWGLGGREPQWTLPADAPGQTGWCNVELQTFRFPGHPQDASENAVDLAHLRYVHGYHSVARVALVSIDGHRLESRFDFISRRRIIKGLNMSLEIEISANTLVCGLGYSFVEIREHTTGTDWRLWVLATPVDGQLIDLTLASQIREIRNPKHWIAGLGFLPVKLRAPAMNKIISAFQKQDVLQDVAIWSRKRYVARPRLCRSDGEIMPFRAYCAQFYAVPQNAGEPAPTEPEAAVR